MPEGYVLPRVHDATPGVPLPESLTTPAARARAEAAMAQLGPRSDEERAALIQEWRRGRASEVTAHDPHRRKPDRDGGGGACEAS